MRDDSRNDATHDSRSLFQIRVSPGLVEAMFRYGVQACDPVESERVQVEDVGYNYSRREIVMLVWRERRDGGRDWHDAPVWTPRFAARTEVERQRREELAAAPTGKASLGEVGDTQKEEGE